jgi:hypothetical protein
MPFEVVFDHLGRRVTVTGHGVGSFEDVYRAIQGVAQHAELRPGYGILVLLDEFTYEPSPDELMRLGRTLSLLRGKVFRRLALVVTGVGRVTRVSLIALSATGDDGEVRVFLTRGEAEEWLSV